MWPALYSKSLGLVNLNGVPPMVMLKSAAPWGTVCGTTMARHSLPTHEGRVAVGSTSPALLTVPLARLMLALRATFCTSTIFSVAAHSSAVNPVPWSRVTRAFDMRCDSGRRITLLVGATSSTFPQRKSLASYPPISSLEEALLWSFCTSNW